ncbi:hypothetical protein TNCV_2784101 [Trichonephila clavipes]|nr:hypothetical protein TNCV_2784101 [Trichonephila clavipes]
MCTIFVVNWRDEIQLTDLAVENTCHFLPKSISEGLVVSKHCEISSFQHIPKVSDSRVDSKGVHGRRHCVHIKSKRGQKVKDEQEVQHQQELVYTSEMPVIASEDQFKGFESFLPLNLLKDLT